MASLLYGSGFRLTECLKLRVKDVDFELCKIIVRGGKGDNDRRSILPSSLEPQLRSQIERVKLKLEENMSINEFSGASVQELLGHKDVRTTMVYTHVLNRTKLNVQSPIDS